MLTCAHSTSAPPTFRLSKCAPVLSSSVQMFARSVLICPSVHSLSTSAHLCSPFVFLHLSTSTPVHTDRYPSLSTSECPHPPLVNSISVHVGCPHPPLSNFISVHICSSVHIFFPLSTFVRPHHRPPSVHCVPATAAKCPLRQAGSLGGKQAPWAADRLPWRQIGSLGGR